MATQLFRNNASSTLAVSIGTGDTTVQVGSGLGALFPAPGAGEFFLIAIEDTLGNIEICRCTSRSSDLLTVTRAQESTTARAFTAPNARVELRLTRATMERFVQKESGVVADNIQFTGTVQLPATTTVNGSTPWTAANDGAGSGLDADLLDGQSSAAFATASHNHAASETTSGTFADARIAQSNVTQHQTALSIAETQIPDGALLARVGGNETITGSYNFTARPKTTSQGGFLSHVSSGNTGGSVTVSTSDPSGTPADGDLWLKREA